MDEFGFEPRHAGVAARSAAAATGADAAGAEADADADTAEGTAAGAGAEAARSSTTAAAGDGDEAQCTRRPRASTSPPAPPAPHQPPKTSLQRPPGAVRRDMPRPKAPQASAQHVADGSDERLQVRAGAEPEEAVPLPQAFTAQYLGARPAAGLWGVRHTRRPVDELVAAARASPAPLPLQRLRVSAAGVAVFPEGGAGAGAGAGTQAQGGAAAPRPLRHHDIGAISYGVQDLVYTRVFCFIVVSEQRGPGQLSAAAPGAAPVFQCHAYVCESRAAARALTHALAAAFRAFSRELRRAGPGARDLAKRRFKIDLRSPEQLAADLAASHGDSSDA